MMHRKLAALLAFEGFAISALHRLGSRPGFGIRWTDLPAPTTRLDDAVASGLRYLTLTLAYWLLASTVLYVCARLVDLQAALRAVQWATLPVVRRLVDRTLAVGLTVGTLVTPAQAMVQTVPPPVEQIYIPTPAGVPEEPVVDAQTVVPPWASLPAAPPPAGNPSTDLLDHEPVDSLPANLLFDGSETHAVEVGESLWSIAEHRLRLTTGTPPSDAATATYWVELIAANRDRLISGDPDLIYPGEVLVIPPVAP
ncbi:MAG: LysM peptidoglycan-binding domain-containing protein [Acidimicrobiia bacterium]|nr:LysM peptidoglycan-binding domain-containing protein [Acidimicrobiia bacterium]